MRTAIEIVLLVIVGAAAFDIPHLTSTTSTGAVSNAEAVSNLVAASIRRKAWMMFALGLASLVALIVLEVYP